MAKSRDVGRLILVAFLLKVGEKRANLVFFFSVGGDVHDLYLVVMWSAAVAGSGEKCGADKRRRLAV